MGRARERSSACEGSKGEREARRGDEEVFESEEGRAARPEQDVERHHTGYSIRLDVERVAIAPRKAAIAPLWPLPEPSSADLSPIPARQRHRCSPRDSTLELHRQ
jgi:hypothetical protein